MEAHLQLFLNTDKPISSSTRWICSNQCEYLLLRLFDEEDLYTCMFQQMMHINPSGTAIEGHKYSL